MTDRAPRTSSAPLTDAMLEDLRARLDGTVTTDPATLAELSADSSARSRKATAAGTSLALADLAVHATSRDDVVAVMRWATRHGVPVTVRAGGSGVVGSGLPVAGGVLLDVSGLTEVGPVDVENALVTVGAGAIGAQVEAALAGTGLAVGHYPQSFYLASVGGWVTMRGSGTFSSLHGNVEDRLADLEVVLPDGEVLRTRSVPRASEGPDLKQLFIGSEGTLGVITAVTLRLVPVPAARRFASARFDTFADALTVSRQLLRSGVRPAVLRIYDPAEAKAKHARFADHDGWLLVLLFDGEARLVDAEATIAADLIGAHGGEQLGPEPAENWEERRFDFSWFTDAVSLPGGIAEAIEMAATWSALPSLYEEVKEAAAGVMGEVMGHVSHVYDQGASLYVISRGRFTDDAAAIAAYDRLWEVVMDVATRRGVRISHHHGIGTERARWMPTELGPIGMRTLRAVKDALDPTALMNPGTLGL